MSAGDAPAKASAPPPLPPPARSNPTRAGIAQVDKERLNTFVKQTASWEWMKKRVGDVESVLKGERCRNQALRTELAKAREQISELEAAVPPPHPHPPPLVHPHPHPHHHLNPYLSTGSISQCQVKSGQRDSCVSSCCRTLRKTGLTCLRVPL